MNVVATGMHGGHQFAEIIGHAVSAGEGESRLLPDWQPIQVGPQQQHRSDAVGEHAHHAMAANLARDCDAGALQFIGDAASGFRLLVG